MGRPLSVLLIALVSVALAGCATPSNPHEIDEGSEVTQLTLDEAKSITIERRDEIAAFLPESASSDVTSTETSKALVPCGGEDLYKWPGITIAKITGEVDPAQVVEDVAAEWETREGWSVERGVTEAGLDRVTLTNEDGSMFSVGFHVKGTEFWVDSYSPCFVLPGGPEYGTEY